MGVGSMAGFLFRISLPQQLDSINSSFAPSLNETKPCKQAVLDGEGLEKQRRQALRGGACSGAKATVRDGRSGLQATARKAPLGEGLRQAGGGGGEGEGGGKRQETGDK